MILEAAKPSWGRFKATFSILLTGLLISSCALTHTMQPRGKDLEHALEMRDIPAALSIAGKPKQYRPKDRVLYYLDAGLLNYYNGDWKKSNKLLQKAEEAIEELNTKSISKSAASMLLNDNSLDYSGEDYEDVYINVFKALNFLKLGDREAAFVEVRRIDEKLGYLEQSYAQMEKELHKDAQLKSAKKSKNTKFHASALARYLSLMMYESEGNFDAARIDLENIRYAFNSQSELYPFSMPELIDPSAKSLAPVLRVLAFVNRGPIKKAKEMHIHSSEDLLLVGSVDETVEVFSLHWPDIHEGYYFKFALPDMVERPARVSEVVAVTPDGSRYSLAKLEDMSLVARQTFEIKKSLIQLKSITRSVLKGLAAEKAKSKASRNSSSLFAALMMIAADVAVFISENADLRLAQFFPAQAMVAEIPLSAGQHEINLEYYSAAGNLLYRDLQTVKVQPGSVNLVQSWCL